MSCSCPPETFWSLLQDAAHWEFELFLMLFVDGLVIGLIRLLIWPKFHVWLHRHFTGEIK